MASQRSCGGSDRLPIEFDGVFSSVDHFLAAERNLSPLEGAVDP